MSTGSTSETTSPGTSNKTSTISETAINDTSSSEGKDLLHSLKGHVSFAKQCLGLLQNQMKHAMDTLDILQDQVTKAQSTIDKIERKGNKQTSSQKGKSVVGNDYRALIEDGSQGAAPIQSHRMIVIDSNGQPLYAVDKPGTSYGIPVQHQVGPCLCSACTNEGQPVYISGQDHACIEKGQQIVTVHPGQAVYPLDEKQVVSVMETGHDVNDDTNGELKAASSSESYSCQKKRKCSCPTYISNSPKSDADEHCLHSPNASNSNTGSNSTPKVLGNSSKSTSPIATQLLQVIDVLQNAGDEENKDLETSFTRSFRCESTHSSPMPFTGPVPHPVYTASGTGILAATRKARKQDMSPIKKENQPRQDTQYSGRDGEREAPELMKVPPPVLAATLEPDFLVVPGNSYFADSPPSAVSAASREKEKAATATRDADKKSYERRLSRESQSTSTDAKKERGEAMRSSSVSSTSQASEGSSRSASESSSSEKGAPRGLDESKDSEPKTENRDTFSRRSSHEDKPKDLNSVYLPNSFHKHPNGDSVDSRVSSVDTTATTGASTRHAKPPSLLNSIVREMEASNKQSSPLSPNRCSTRSLKVTPLNSVTSALTEMRRNTSFEYTPNPGIVRISHATPMTSAVPSTNQSRTDTPRLTSTASPDHSNDKLTSSRNSFVRNCGSESDLSLVTTYSVAQISNDEANSPCTSPSKRPNILSRNRQGKKDIPQGIVVLVPTIEDAKQLIKSSGGNQGNTPVLVPQNVLNQYSTNGEVPKSSADSHVSSSSPGKRPHFSETNVSHSRPKRRLNEPLVID